MVDGMPILLPNIIFSTSRSQYNATTGTTKPQNNLMNIAGHIAPVRATQLAVLPPDAAGSQVVLTVESGTDIVIGDIITAMYLNDGITVWPAFNGAATYVVRFVQETAPLVLPTRIVYVEIVIATGPAF